MNKKPSFLYSAAVCCLLFSHYGKAQVTNVQISGIELLQEGNRIALSVYEPSEGGTDLNGDSDVADIVLHVFHFPSASGENLGFDVGPRALNGNWVAFPVYELDQGGTDLNGDGDFTDHILHVYNAATKTMTNVGLDANGFQLDDGRVAFLVNEAQQYGMDLNGDGDALDNVLHVYAATTGTSTNVQLEASSYRLDGSLVAFKVSEGGQGGTDLNGDGDAMDHVLHVYDSVSGTVTNVGLDASSTVLDVDNGLIAFSVFEFHQNQTDLNGDGDIFDHVLHVYNTATGTTTNLGLATNTPVEIEANRLVFLVRENAQGATDLNGDGDAIDPVLHVYDSVTGSTTNVGINSLGFLVDRNVIAFQVLETREGGTDLNGDGDAFDRVLHVFDAVSGITTNVGLDSGFSFFLTGKHAAFAVIESSQGGTDLNGDGDAFDRVLHVFDVVSGATTNLELAVSFSGFDLDRIAHGNHIAFTVLESSQGGVDLNSDGDAVDAVLHTYNTATGNTKNVGFDARRTSLQGNQVAFLVDESRQGGQDLNGDGDTLDFVLHLLLAR